MANTGKQSILFEGYEVYKTGTKVNLEVNIRGMGITATTQIGIPKYYESETYEGNIPETEIGSNKALIGKSLKILCAVTNTSKETAETKMEVHLNGGPEPGKWVLEAELEKGDTHNFIMIINFLYLKDIEAFFE